MSDGHRPTPSDWRRVALRPVFSLVAAMTLGAACQSVGACDGSDQPTPGSARQTHDTSTRQKVRERLSNNTSNKDAGAATDGTRSLRRGTARQRKALSRAKQAVMLKRSEDALRAFGDVLEEGPWSQAQLEAVTHLVQMLLERDRVDRALKLLDNQVPDRDSHLESLRLLRARAHSRAGDFQTAISMYREILEDRPERLVLYPRLAALYERTDQPDRASDMRSNLDARVREFARQLNAPGTTTTSKLGILDALGQVSTPEAIQAATDALTDSSVDVQTAAARTLGDMGASRALPELRALKKRASDTQVANASEAAIRRIQSNR
jgi:tetratricopeptide (TPR) repeat protein